MTNLIIWKLVLLCKRQLFLLCLIGWRLVLPSMRGGTPSSSSCYGPTEPGTPQWDWILIQDWIKQPVKWRTTDCVLMEAVYHKWIFAVSTHLYLFVPSLFVHTMFPLMTFFEKKKEFQSFIPSENLLIVGYHTVYLPVPVFRS